MVVSFGFAVLGVALLGLVVPGPAAGRAPGRAAARRLRWRDVATPGLIRLLVVAGVLGLLTVGDGFIYLALLDRGGFAAHWFPLLYVGTNIAYLVPRHPARPARRPGRPGQGADRRPRCPAGGVRCRRRSRWDVAASTRRGARSCSARSTPPPTASSPRSPAGWCRRRCGPAGSRRRRPSWRVARMASSAGFGVLWFALRPAGRAGRCVGRRCSSRCRSRCAAVRRLDRRRSEPAR